MTIGLNRVLSQLDGYAQPLFQPHDLKTAYSDHSTTTLVHAAPQDRKLIDAIISERQSHSTDLTQELEQLQAIRERLDVVEAKLEERRSHVRDSLRFHCSLTAPIQRLPPEILGEIFQFCSDTSPQTFGVGKCRLVLTQVCQRWRSIALGTPRLWSCLKISLQKAARGEYRLACDTWLARARGVPLSVWIWNGPNTSLTRHLADWLQSLVIRSSAFRWDGYPPKGLPTITGTAELLETLDITFDSREDARSFHISAPKLGSLALELFYHFNSLDHIMLSWERLTEINIKARTSFSTCLRLLEVCTCLQSVTLSVSRKELDGLRAVYPGSVSNRSLKVLTIRIQDAALAQLFFDTIVLPSLEVLQLYFRPCSKIWPHAQFTSFLRRSCCPLKELTTFNHESVSQHFSEYQTLLPSSCILHSSLLRGLPGD